MKVFKVFVSVFALSIISFGTTSIVSAEVDSDLVLIDENDYNYAQEEIDWSTVDEIITLYDDGTSRPQSQEEIEKRAELELSGNYYKPLIMPRSSNGYFSKVEWIIRNGDPSLSLYPINPWTIKKNSAFRYLQSVWLFPHHPMFKEFSRGNSTATMSMYNQFVCHADFARGLKVPWNLEPWKKDKGYWGFANFSSKCN